MYALFEWLLSHYSFDFPLQICKKAHSVSGLHIWQIWLTLEDFGGRGKGVNSKPHSPNHVAYQEELRYPKVVPFVVLFPLGGVICPLLEKLKYLKIGAGRRGF